MSHATAHAARLSHLAGLAALLAQAQADTQEGETIARLRARDAHNATHAARDAEERREAAEDAYLLASENASQYRDELAQAEEAHAQAEASHAQASALGLAAHRHGPAHRRGVLRNLD